MKKSLLLIIGFLVLVSCTTKTTYPSVIEIVGDDTLSPHRLTEMNLQATLYSWKNHIVAYGVFPDAEKTKQEIEDAYPEASVRLYNQPFYIFDRQKCDDTSQVRRWSHTIMTANLIADTVLQEEYMDYHARQMELFPEVAQGFCRADFQQLLIFRNGRQLMLIISIPEGENLDDLNPKTTENNPRVDEWNALMAKYQEGIEGTEPGEGWIILEPIKEEPRNIYVMTGFREPADAGLRFIFSRDGYQWTDLGPNSFLHPVIGTEKVMRDPSIVVGPDGAFHLVWTTSWRNDFGFGYASSKDLVNWSEQRHVIVNDYDTTFLNVWAPELFYDAEHDEFSIAWASSSPARFDGTQRQYYTITKDFQTFTPAALFYDPGYNSIDGAVMKRGAGDYVLVVKDNRKPGSRNLHLAFGNTPVGPWSNETESFGPQNSEGPTWVQVEDGWLIYYDAYREYRFGAHFTDDFQTFTDVSDKISVPKAHKHGTVFMITESQLKVLQEAAGRILVEEEKARMETENKTEGGQ